MTSDIEMLPLPSVLLNWPHPTNHAAIRDYARAVAEHNVKERDAEIEALRAEVAAWEGLHASEVQVRQRWQARAERLAEALRELVAYVRETAHHNAPAAAAARAALRDHDQEGGNP